MLNVSKDHLDIPNKIKVIDIGFKYMRKNYHPDREIESFVKEDGTKVTYKIYRHRPCITIERNTDNYYPLVVYRYTSMPRALAAFKTFKEAF